MAKTQGELRPGDLSAAGAKAGLGVAIFMFIFGAAFFFVVMQDMSPSETGLTFLIVLFFCVFLGVCVMIMVLCRRVIKAARKAPADSLLEFRIDAEGAAPPEQGDFAERLRKLEGLKRDGLITEAEYRQKRQAIMEEDW